MSRVEIVPVLNLEFVGIATTSESDRTTHVRVSGHSIRSGRCACAGEGCTLNGEGNGDGEGAFVGDDALDALDPTCTWVDVDSPVVGIGIDDVGGVAVPTKRDRTISGEGHTRVRGNLDVRGNSEGNTEVGTSQRSLQ